SNATSALGLFSPQVLVSAHQAVVIDLAHGRLRLTRPSVRVADGDFSAPACVHELGRTYVIDVRVAGRSARLGGDTGEPRTRIDGGSAVGKALLERTEDKRRDSELDQLLGREVAPDRPGTVPVGGVIAQRRDVLLPGVEIAVGAQTRSIDIAISRGG